MRLSDAANRLQEGIWGGLTRAQLHAQLKRKYPRLPIGFSPRREVASQRLMQAIRSDEIPVYVTAEAGGKPVRVPVDVLRKLLSSRGLIPDRTTRASYSWVRDGLIDRQTFVLLRSGLLVIREDEFSLWYRGERQKGKWASQRKKKGPRRGRPSLQTETLRNRILKLFDDGKWRAIDGIPVLRRHLTSSGRTAPSEDTLRRAVDGLHKETGDPSLQPTRRPKLRPPALSKRVDDH